MFRELDDEAVCSQPFQDFRGSGFGADQSRHLVIIHRCRFRAHEPGADHFDVDAARRQVEGQGFGKRDQRRLGRAIGCRFRQAAPSGHRRDNGDLAAAPSCHSCDQRGEGIDHPHIVYIHMPGIDGRIDFQAVLRDIHAGIQDGAIDRPLLVDSILDGRGESRGVGDITGRTVKIPAAVIKRGQPVFAARHRGDLVAAPQQRCRQRGSDA